MIRKMKSQIYGYPKHDCMPGDAERIAGQSLPERRKEHLNASEFNKAVGEPFHMSGKAKDFKLGPKI